MFDLILLYNSITIIIYVTRVESDTFLLICIYPVFVTVSATDSGYVVDDFHRLIFLNIDNCLRKKHFYTLRIFQVKQKIFPPFLLRPSVSGSDNPDRPNIPTCLSFLQHLLFFLSTQSSLMHHMVCLFLSSWPSLCKVSQCTCHPACLPSVFVSQESLHNYLLARRCVSQYVQEGLLKTCEDEEWILSKQKNNLTPSSCAMMRSHQIEGRARHS